MGTLNVRSHQAVVTIPYTTKTYSILYKDSSNLKYDAEKQTIHENYTGWIQRLDGAIRSRLTAAACSDIKKEARLACWPPPETLTFSTQPFAYPNGESDQTSGQETREIHRNYYGWIENLDNAIRTQFIAAGP